LAVRCSGEAVLAHRLSFCFLQAIRANMQSSDRWGTRAGSRGAIPWADVTCQLGKCQWHALGHHGGVLVNSSSRLHCQLLPAFGKPPSATILAFYENFAKTTGMTFGKTRDEYSWPRVIAWHTVPVGNLKISRG